MRRQGPSPKQWMLDGRTFNVPLTSLLSKAMRLVMEQAGAQLLTCAASLDDNEGHPKLA